MKIETMKVQSAIEKQVGALIRRGWVLDGAGHARFGWYALLPCQKRYLGRSLDEVATRLEVQS